MRTRKRAVVILAAVLALLMCIWTAVSMTAAYYSREDKAVNVVTMGNLKVTAISVVRTENGEIKDFDGACPTVPGEKVPWVLSVKNSGAHDAYVRVRLDKNIKLAEGVTGEPDADVLEFVINEKDWTFKEGYYYCNKALVPGEVSAPLFEGAGYSADMSNLYQGSVAGADVYIAGTQVANNGTDVFTAAGWPEE